MPANTAGRKAVLNVWNSDGNIVLIELTHPDIATQRIAMSTSDVEAWITQPGGGTAIVTFTAYPFELEPVTDDRGVPRGALRISNVTSLIWNLVGRHKINLAFRCRGVRIPIVIEEHHVLMME